MKIVCLKGGLGNQMFEYCRYRMLKDASDKEDVYLFYDWRKLKQHGGIQLRCFSFRLPRPAVLPFITTVILKACRQLGIFKRLYDDEQDTAILIDDYSQDKRFIANAKELFVFKDTDVPYADVISNSTHPVAVHVRRGDYLYPENASFGLCDKDYFIRAIDYIRRQISTSTFFFFSDDMEWVKQNIKVDGAVYVSDNSCASHDMYLMTLCHSHIISNSTFSFWGARLSAFNGINIYPERWFSTPEWIEPDIFPDEWVRM